MVRNGRTGEPVGGEFQKRGPCRDVSFTHDGRRVLFVAAKGEALLWDLAGDRPVGEPYQIKPPVVLARVSPKGEKVLTSDGSSSRLWDVKERRSLTLPAAKDAEFSPDGKRVLLIEGRENRSTMADDPVGSIWDTKSGARFGEEFTFPSP